MSVRPHFFEKTVSGEALFLQGPNTPKFEAFLGGLSAQKESERAKILQGPKMEQ